MSEFVEVKTDELVGPALDWAVAKAIGYQMIEVPPDLHGNNAGEVLAPTGLIESGYRWPNVGRVHAAAFCKKWSVDWAQGGPLLDKYDIALNGGLADGERVIYATLRAVSDNSPFATAAGPTRLIAVCRAIVAAKLGDVVQVPAELAGVTA